MLAIKILSLRSKPTPDALVCDAGTGTANSVFALLAALVKTLSVGGTRGSLEARVGRRTCFLLADSESIVPATAVIPLVGAESILYFF